MQFTQCCEAPKLLPKNWNSPIFVENKSGKSGKRVPMFAHIIRVLREWNHYNRSLNELSRLSDRELADIGISRCDIPRVAWNAAQER
jgi:uncharacterized protein YjiS (DUF1127 family)